MAKLACSSRFRFCTVENTYAIIYACAAYVCSLFSRPPCLETVHNRLRHVVVYLYLTLAKCTGIAAFSLWPEATALTEMVKVELHEGKKMKFYNV